MTKPNIKTNPKASHAHTINNFPLFIEMCAVMESEQIWQWNPKYVISNEINISGIFLLGEGFDRSI